MIKNQKGQNLLELIVVIAVAIIVVTALVFSTISSLRNAQFAQNQSQATKFAQEWIEKLKIHRDKNELIYLGGGATISWISSTIPPNDFLSNPLIQSLGVDGICYFELATEQSKDKLQFFLCSQSPQELSNSNSQQVDETGRFRRTIIVSNNGSNQKKFTVIVSWIDFSGTHESRLTTILGKN